MEELEAASTKSPVMWAIWRANYFLLTILGVLCGLLIIADTVTLLKSWIGFLGYIVWPFALPITFWAVIALPWFDAWVNDSPVHAWVLGIWILCMVSVMIDWVCKVVLLRWSANHSDSPPSVEKLDGEEPKLKLIRWLLLLPGAFLCLMIGSLVGGVAVIFLGQTAVDTSSAFFASFGFVYGAGLIAPSRRSGVRIAACGVTTVLASLSFILGVYTSIPEFSDLPIRDKVQLPVAQLLGALYAMFLAPLLPGSAAEREGVWRNATWLGAGVTLLGVPITIAGLITGPMEGIWVGVEVGGGVVLLGIMTLFLSIFKSN